MIGRCRLEKRPKKEKTSVVRHPSCSTLFYPSLEHGQSGRHRHKKPSGRALPRAADLTPRATISGAGGP